MTGDPIFLEPQVAAISALEARYAGLEGLLDGDREQIARVRAIRDEGAGIRRFQEEVIALRHASERGANDRIRTFEGKVRMDRVRSLFRALVDAEEVKRDARTLRSQRETRFAIALVVGLLVIGALVQATLAQMLGELRSRDRLAAERERSAAEIAAQKRWLETVLEQMPVGVALADASGRLLHRNPVMTVYQGGAPMPGSVHEGVQLRALHPDGRPFERSEYPLVRAVRGETVTDEIVWPQPDGSGRECSVSAAPVRSATGEILGAVAVLLDVSERKRQERLLRESEERERAARQEAERVAALLDSFVAASPVGVSVLSEDLRYVIANDAIAAIVGLRAKDLVGRHLSEIVREPDLRRQIEALYRRVLTTGQAESGVEINGRATLDAREIRDWLVTYFPVKLPTGVTLGVGTLVRDITDRKRAEQAMRESEQRERAARERAERLAAQLDSFVAATPEGVALLDVDLRYIFANDAVGTFVGRKGAEFVGRRVDEIVEDPELHAAIATLLRRVLATGKPLTDVELHGKALPGDPAPRDWLVSYFPVKQRDGAVIGVGTVVRDITERKHVEQAMRESEQRERAARAEAEHVSAQLDSFLAASPVGFALLDADLRYLRINDALAEINGVPVAATLGKQPHEFLDASVASVAEPLLRRVIETGKPVEGLEITGHTAASPRERCWISTYYPVKTRAGSIIGVGGVVQEITERKDAERHREELLAREQAARLDAERATRLRDEFLAVVSHDLRNPLNAILLGSSTLLREGSRLDVAETAKRLRDSARRMDRMIQDLLDVARVESGRLSVEVEPISAAELLREAHDAHAAPAEAAEIRLDVHLPETVYVVQADRGRTLQVFSNLVGNAIKFTPAGGTIRIGCELRGDVLMFAVADTGPGMSCEQLPHVFERFWQGKRGEAGGLGLGLYISKALVEAQGGEICCDSKPGKGTTFVFTLPLVKRS